MEVSVNRSSAAAWHLQLSVTGSNNGQWRHCSTGHSLQITVHKSDVMGYCNIHFVQPVPSGRTEAAEI